MTPRHQAALAYAAQGIPIFPVVERGKAPATEHGFKDATTDPALISAWFAIGDWNIGTEPGASNQLVVDIDNKNGKGGSRVWADLCAEHGDPPATMIVRTPNNGWHIYFEGTAPSGAGTERRGLGPGIDARSIGGYVLLPPSVLPTGAYEIVTPGPVAPMPTWISARLAHVEHVAALAPENVVVDPEGIEAWAAALIERTLARDGPAEIGSALNDRTFALAAMLKDGPEAGYTVNIETAVALMRDHWSDEARVEDTVRNAYRTGENEPGCGPIGDPTRKYGDAEYLAEKWWTPPAVTELVNGGSIMLKPVDWIWPGWLARGKFHMLGGEGGAGKSTLCFTLMATITVGGKWPNGAQAPKGDVLIWSGEDDTADTILTRITAAGGDVRRVWFPGKVAGIRAFDPAIDFPLIFEACRKLPNLQVIMVDPIVSASQGDSHKNAETRRGLQPLVDFAEHVGAAVLGVTHFTKNTQGRSPIERITGSLAFGALPRIVWGAEKEEDEAAPRRLVRIKSNIGVSGGGFEYTLEQTPISEAITAQRAVWGRVLQGSARELLEAKSGGQGAKAQEFLAAVLGDAGNAGMLVKDIKAAAAAHSISWSTIERAKAKMPRVQAKKNLGDGAPWYWVMPPIG
jgi:hypothetical protein